MNQSNIRFAIQSLIAAQAAAQAFVASADVALRALGLPAHETDTPPESAPNSGECLHPQQDRLDARTVGHPTRFLCQRCGKEVE